MVFRDDDIAVSTKLDQFAKVDQIFKRFGVCHTIAVIAKDIEKNKDLVEYIRKNKHIRVQSHGWEHIRYTDMDLFRRHLILSKNKLEEVFDTHVTIWYPPWNEASNEMRRISQEVGLEPEPSKTELWKYISAHGKVECDTINFHFWAGNNVDLLPQALEIYTR